MNGIDKVYLLYKDYEDRDGNKSVKACEELSRDIWKDYYPDDYKKPVIPQGEFDKVYGNEIAGDRVYNRFMRNGAEGELSEDFQLDRVINLIIKISTENNNPKIYMNLTNGNNVFTCAMGIAAHMLGACICYVDKNPKFGDGVRVLKDCDAPLPEKLGVTEKSIMKAIGEIYAMHEKKGKNERIPSDIEHERYQSREEQTGVDPAPPHTISDSSSLCKGELDSDSDFYILQSDITDYTEENWSKGLSRSLVSANIHSLHDKHLIVIFDAKKRKDGKISNKWNAIQLTVQGRLVISRM